MISEQDRAALERLTGKAFEVQFLTLMVEHHEGAVEMARTEQGEGRYGPARAMADDIVTARQAEIREMNGMRAARADPLGRQEVPPVSSGGASCACFSPERAATRSGPVSSDQ